MNQDWEPYWQIMREDMPYRDKLAAYAAIGHKRMETERFREFCDRHLGNLAEQTHDFFGTALAKETIRQKVGALFPEHEVESFAEHFWERIQCWRQDFAQSASPF